MTGLEVASETTVFTSLYGVTFIIALIKGFYVDVPDNNI